MVSISSASSSISSVSISIKETPAITTEPSTSLSTPKALPIPVRASLALLAALLTASPKLPNSVVTSGISIFKPSKVSLISVKGFLILSLPNAVATAL